VVGSTGQVQLKGIEILFGLGTVFTKTKLFGVGPGNIPDLFIFDERNLRTANLSRIGEEQCCLTKGRF
jgi:hypothetical protein